MKSRLVSSICISLVVVFALSNTALAATTAFKICKKNSTGALAVRQKCKSGESAITNISTLAGTNGTSSYDTLPSGVTISGIIGGDYEQNDTSGDYRVFHSFPNPVGRTMTNADVIVANTSVVDDECASATCLSSEESTAASSCTGTAAEPTAPSGKVCIYPYTVGHARSITGVVRDVLGETTTKGFGLMWSTVDIGDTYITATWAYTQP